MAIQKTDQIIPEGSTVFYRASLVDQDSVRIPVADVDAITLTLTDSATGTVINSRSAQSVLNTNNGTYVYSNASITGASNAEPVKITATAHGLSNGDWVNITGVTGNSAANGTWKVTIVDDDNFSLNNSSANGNYVSGGTFTYSLFTMEFQPDDNAIVTTDIGEDQVERHRALFEVTYDTDKAVIRPIDLFVQQLSNV